MEQNPDVIIVGAGIAGLRCALECKRKGLTVGVLEAGDRIGGRIKTDRVDGFLLDHGFQVLLTAYDECQSVLNYEQLKLGSFEPGALIWTGAKFEKLVDPWRRPQQFLTAALSRIGTFRDKLKTGRLRSRLQRSSVESIYSGKEVSTETYLRKSGFSPAFIEQFFRPFYGGIFLENELATTNRMFEFVFKMFSEGFAALPGDGMQAIPQQLFKKLNPDSVHLNCRVSEINSNTVRLEDGTDRTAKAVVLATDMTNAANLSRNSIQDRGWNSTTCHYFTAPETPLPEPIIALNGSGSGQITNIAVPTDVNPSYSSNGDALICVSTHPATTADSLKVELKNWFGNTASEFQFLQSFRIPQALPRQLPGDNAFGKADLKNQAGIWICGDYRYTSSIQGALASGRLAGEAVCNSL